MDGVSRPDVIVECVNEVSLVYGVKRYALSSSSKSLTRHSSKSFFIAASESERADNEADGSLGVNSETMSIMGVFVCILPNGEEETGKLETKFGFEKSVGDSAESAAKSAGELLS